MCLQVPVARTRPDGYQHARTDEDLQLLYRQVYTASTCCIRVLDGLWTVREGQRPCLHASPLNSQDFHIAAGQPNTVLLGSNGRSASPSSQQLLESMTCFL